MNDDRPPGPIQQTKAVLSWIAFIAGVLAVSVEVFLRRSRTFGERYMGVQAALVILLVPIYCAWWGGYDVRPLFYFLAAYLFMCLVIRMAESWSAAAAEPRSTAGTTGFRGCAGSFPVFAK